jgi:putative oxidoreductase
MQRLFSIFPNSWPGVGLLLLRISAALSLILGTISVIGHAVLPLSLFLDTASIVLGILLMIGFCTPIAALGQVTIETWLLLSASQIRPVAAVSAVVGISLIMLGPGAWSIDSRLFGRRQIELPRN